MSKLKTIIAFMAIGLFIGSTAYAARYHVTTNGSKDGAYANANDDGLTGIQTLICYDCHTMHSSDGKGFTAADPYNDGRGFFIAKGTDGTLPPDGFLLKGTVSGVCLACHDGQIFAPDVMNGNTNVGSYDKGRSAGALNDASGTDGYQAYMGHSIGNTDDPPGYNAGADLSNWYNNKYDTLGLQCISCHYQHGRIGGFRNLAGPKSQYDGTVLSSLRTASNGFTPTQTVDTTNDSSKDVWVNVSNSYIGGSGAPDFNYYSFGKVRYNRIDQTFNPNGTSHKSSNKTANLCATCHVDLHGGRGDANIGSNDTDKYGFLRHPTGQAGVGEKGGGRWSSALNYTSADDGGYKVHTAAIWTGWNTTDVSTSKPTPFCLTCHKAHGNKNPFGLFFLKSTADAVSDEGSGLTGSTTKDYQNLCSQCHNTQSG